MTKECVHTYVPRLSKDNHNMKYKPLFYQNQNSKLRHTIPYMFNKAIDWQTSVLPFCLTSEDSRLSDFNCGL